VAPSLPAWLPASKVSPSNITPVAWFTYSFDALASRFSAKPSRDRKGGGAGPVRSFFLRIGPRSIAEVSQWEARPGQIELSLPVNDRGVVLWEHFEAVMGHVPVPLAEVHRQGAFHWRRRSKPTSAAALEP
jgi:hypothetical protein